MLPHGQNHDNTPMPLSLSPIIPWWWWSPSSKPCFHLIGENVPNSSSVSLSLSLKLSSSPSLKALLGSIYTFLAHVNDDVFLSYSVSENSVAIYKYIMHWSNSTQQHKSVLKALFNQISLINTSRLCYSLDELHNVYVYI